jgi:hypothetical protein
MSFDATKWVRAQAFTDPLHRYLALEIADYADTHGKAWPSVEKLAEVTLLAERTVKYKLAEMEGLGFLRREKRWKKGHQTSNLISLAMKNMGASRAPMHNSKSAPHAPMPPTMGARGAPCMGARGAPEPSKGEPVRKKEPVRLSDAPSALAFEDAPVHMNGLAKEASNAQFERFWSAYPKRDGSNPRKPAADKFRSLLEKHNVSPEEIIRGAQRYSASVADKEGPERRYIAQAITWLNQERWKDEHRKPERYMSGAEYADQLRREAAAERGEEHVSELQRIQDEVFGESPTSDLPDPDLADLDLSPDQWMRH